MIQETHHKIATFSFDDGGPGDRPVIDLFNSRGLTPTVYLIATLVNISEMVYGCPSKDLKEFYAGAEVGSHTMSHPHLSHCTYLETQHEVMKSKQIIEDIIEREVTLFANPYGSFHAATDECLRVAGYQWGRRIHRSYDKVNQSPFAMPINCMLHSDDEEAILQQRLAAGLPIHALCHSYYIERAGWMPKLIRWLDLAQEAGYEVLPNSTYFERTF